MEATEVFGTGQKSKRISSVEIRQAKIEQRFGSCRWPSSPMPPQCRRGHFKGHCHGGWLHWIPFGDHFWTCLTFVGNVAFSFPFGYLYFMAVDLALNGNDSVSFWCVSALLGGAESPVFSRIVSPPLRRLD